MSRTWGKTDFQSLFGKQRCRISIPSMCSPYVTQRFCSRLGKWMAIKWRQCSDSVATSVTHSHVLSWGGCLQDQNLISSHSLGNGDFRLVVAVVVGVVCSSRRSSSSCSGSGCCCCRHRALGTQDNENIEIVFLLILGSPSGLGEY